MALLDNKYNFIDDDEQEDEAYTLPAVVRKNDEGINFKDSLAMSTVLHPLTVMLIWMFIFIAGILGIKFVMFDKPHMTKDIEFVLVDREAMPRDMNTRNRADMNSRSGGVNNPNKPVSLPSAAPSKPSKPSSSSSSLQKMIQKQQKQIQREQKQVIKQQRVQQQQAAKAPARKQPSPAPRPSAQRPAAPTVAPSTRPVAAPPKVAIKPSTPFSVPIPSGLPAAKSLSTGPVGGTSSSTSRASSGGYSSGGSSAGRYAPAPSLAPSRSGGSGQLARGSGGGSSGNVGNPGGGGGRPGIDAIREPDFGPYMRELQRRIKLNWNPPKGNESKRVVLLFKIAKSGRMLSCRVLKSSGLPAADQAALRAVELTAPFRPLPAEFRGQSIDIQFTFDYNVFGANRY